MIFCGSLFHCKLEIRGGPHKRNFVAQLREATNVMCQFREGTDTICYFVIFVKFYPRGIWRANLRQKHRHKVKLIILVPIESSLIPSIVLEVTHGLEILIQRLPKYLIVMVSSLFISEVVLHS